jgi:hypothetical protein
MPNHSYQEVDAAANSVNNTYGKNPWFLGVGIGKENDEFIVSVRVSKNSNVSLPKSIHGIPINVIEQDMPVAL